MKALIIALLLIISSLDSMRQREESKPVLKVISKGAIYFFKGDSINDPCHQYIYYLVETKLINNTNLSQEFFTTSCLSGENIISEITELKNCFNTCTYNTTLIIKLNPNQEFVMPVLFRSKTSIKGKIKFGFVYISPEACDIDNYHAELYKSAVNKQKNIIWSEPIQIRDGYATPYEVR